MIKTFLEDRTKRDNNMSFLDASPSFPAHFRSDRVHYDRKGSEISGDRIACAAINFQASSQNQSR